jgi:hypothetical protein
MRYYVGLLGLVIGYLGLCGCAGSDPASAVPTAKVAPARIPVRLIIKFRAADNDHSRPGYLERLYRDTGVKLSFVRAMSGGAYVFTVEEPSDPSRLDATVERLGNYPDIEYTEIDRRRVHQFQ